MKYLFTPLYWVLFLLTLPVCFGTVLLVFLVTAPFDRNRAVVHRFVCGWCFFYSHLSPGWRVRVEGRELLPPGPCVLVANHQSMADIFAAAALFRPFKFVSKAFLFKLPLLGWIMRLAGYVSVERGRPRSMQDMLEVCRAWLRRGVPVLLFPEGTYSQNGVLLPFKRGPFRLAMEARVPVVPVILQGTTDVIEGDGPWMNPRATIRVRVCPPLLPETFGSDDAALVERVRALYLEALQPGAGAPAGAPQEEPLALQRPARGARRA
jgi:1-acyl-sn-glycerol-3-phosphate acyltransferase